MAASQQRMYGPQPSQIGMPGQAPSGIGRLPSGVSMSPGMQPPGGSHMSGQPAPPPPPPPPPPPQGVMAGTDIMPPPPHAQHHSMANSSASVRL